MRSRLWSAFGARIRVRLNSENQMLEDRGAVVVATHDLVACSVHYNEKLPMAEVRR